jgi:hypothetical protein
MISTGDVMQLTDHLLHCAGVFAYQSWLSVLEESSTSWRILFFAHV